MPIWKTWSPRASAVYDLIGDGKTAVRFGFNRFQSAATTTFAGLYDPANALIIQTTAPWKDRNGDNIAQGNPGCSFAIDPACEINFATVPANFGTISLSSPDPGVTRPFADAYNVGITREVRPIIDKVLEMGDRIEATAPPSSSLDGFSIKDRRGWCDASMRVAVDRNLT